MPTKVPQICRIGSLRSWTSSAAFITCPSLQSSKICPTLLTHPLIDWHCHLLSCLGQLTRWLKYPLFYLNWGDQKSVLSSRCTSEWLSGRGMPCQFQFDSIVKRSGPPLQWNIFMIFLTSRAWQTQWYNSYNCPAGRGRGSTNNISSQPGCNNLCCAQQQLFTSCDSKTCPIFTSLGKCHICSPRGKFCVSVYLTINLKLPTVRTGDPPPFSCVMDINSANLNLNLWEKTIWNENMPS